MLNKIAGAEIAQCLETAYEIAVWLSQSSSRNFVKYIIMDKTPLLNDNCVTPLSLRILWGLREKF